VSLRSRHLGSLDGLRALAVAAVVAYHLNLPWARGGFLGVDLFFVLSGFLITSLLLDERSETGGIDLVGFWRRRARRLLPALYVMLIVVCMWPLVTNRLGIYAWSSVNLATLRAYGVSSIFYVTNWVVIASGRTYFAQFSAPSPLAHTFSRLGSLVHGDVAELGLKALLVSGIERPAHSAMGCSGPPDLARMADPSFPGERS